MLPRTLLPRPLTAVLVSLATLASMTFATLVLTTSPAHAAVTGTTSAPDVMLRNACRRIPIDYQLQVDPGTTHWKVKINVESPDDDAPEGFDLSSSQGDALEGTLRYLVCGSDSPGTYTVRGLGSYQTGLPVANVAFELTESTFAVRRAPTRTTMTIQDVGHGKWRVVATVKAWRKGEFRRVSNAPVRLQRLVEGRWSPMRKSVRLTNNGRVTYLVRWPAGTSVRAVTQAQGFRGGSVSRAATLHR